MSTMPSNSSEYFEKLIHYEKVVAQNQRTGRKETALEPQNRNFGEKTGTFVPALRKWVWVLKKSNKKYSDEEDKDEKCTQ